MRPLLRRWRITPAVVVAFACATDRTVGPATVTALLVAPDSLAVGAGQTGQLTAIAIDEDGIAYVGVPTGWATQDPAVATVSEGGLVRDPRVRDRLSERIDAAAFRGHGDDDRDAQDLAEPVGLNAAATLFQLVGHVEDQQHGLLALDELQRQEECPAEVLRVGNLDDRRIGLLRQQSDCDAGVFGARRQVVDPGRVDDLEFVSVQVRLRPDDLHCCSWVVRNHHVVVCQVLEEKALADVRIAGEDDPAGPARNLARIGDSVDYLGYERHGEHSRFRDLGSDASLGDQAR